ncbi:MAG: LamB/YcsF family protein [Verrucomicrobiales bacterium]|nr:LamB/YcsF family protein [Verrucomicrobiales bacterium]
MPHPLPLDLNCDLGEGEPAATTAACLVSLDSINIACGGHAGTEDSMRFCLAQAQSLGVHAGAHPGIPDRTRFGRATDHIPTPAELAEWIVSQVERLHALARAAEVPLHHIKLHGALYHLTDTHPDLAATYLQTVARRWPHCLVYARAGGLVAGLAPSYGLTAWPEAFLDRGYRPDGSLVPRDQPNALLTDPRRLVARLNTLQLRGGWEDCHGAFLPLAPRTLCLHGDSPDAAALLAAARTALGPRSAH